MKTKLINKLLAGLTLVLLAGTANATPVLGTSLQTALNGITQGGAFYNVNTAQYLPDEMWEITASGASVTALVLELAGFAASNTFGIYDINNTANRLELFDGASTTGDKRVLSLSGTTFEVIDLSVPALLGSATFSSTLFGYYLDSSANVGGGIFYSQSSLNTNTSGGNGGTTDHMVAYRGNDILQIDTDGAGGNGYATFSSGEFILAFEDLNYNTGSDYNFADMVVLVESVIPVPEPAPLTLLGLGVMGLGALGLRKRKAD